MPCHFRHRFLRRHAWMQPRFHLALLCTCCAWPALAADPPESATPQPDTATPTYFEAIAAKRGVELPAPFGVSMIYSNASQKVLTNSFLLTTNGGTQQPVNFASFDNSVVDTESVLLRLDYWLLPFFNLFGFVGQTSNTVNGVFSAPVDDLIASAGSDACVPDANGNRPFVCDGNFVSTRSTQNNATQYGGGALLASGYGPYFGLLGIIYSTTAQSGSSAQVSIFTLSPKLGRRWSLGDNGELAVYGAASWVQADARAQDSVKVETRGIGGLPDPLVISYDITLVNDGDWSYGFGANWDISRSWFLQGEFSTGARDSLMAQIGRRFDF